MFTYRVDETTQLRLATSLDAEALYPVIRESRAHLARWLPWADESLDQLRSFLSAALERYGRHEGFHAVIEVQGRWVGAVGLEIDSANRSGRIGYWLSAHHQGSGIMTRSVASVLQLGFVDSGLHRLEIRAATENAKSIGVAERLGFRREGLIREAEWVDNRFVDHVIFGLLAKDWYESGRTRYSQGT